MSDHLPATILAGTAQMESAAEGLARVRSAGVARKKAAFEAIGEASREMDKTFNQYGDWRTAHAAEDDERQLSDAYTHGLAAGGPEKALVAIDAIHPRAAHSAKAKADLTTKLAELTKTKYESQLQEAQVHDIESRTQERQDKLGNAAKSQTFLQNWYKSNPIPEDAGEYTREFHNQLQQMAEGGQYLDPAYVKNGAELARRQDDSHSKEAKASLDALTKKEQNDRDIQAGQAYDAAIQRGDKDTDALAAASQIGASSAAMDRLRKNAQARTTSEARQEGRKVHEQDLQKWREHLVSHYDAMQKLAQAKNEIASRQLDDKQQAEASSWFRQAYTTMLSNTKSAMAETRRTLTSCRAAYSKAANDTERLQIIKQRDETQQEFNNLQIQYKDIQKEMMSHSPKNAPAGKQEFTDPEGELQLDPKTGKVFIK